MNALGRNILGKIGMYYIFVVLSLVLAWFAYTRGNLNPYLFTLIFIVVIMFFINLESRLFLHKWIGWKETIGSFIGTTVLAHFTLLLLSLPGFATNQLFVVIAMAVVGLILSFCTRNVSSK